MSYSGIYTIAEKTFLLNTAYEYSHIASSEYASSKSPEFTIEIFASDITFEQKKSDLERKIEGLAPYKFQPEYLEFLAVLRKLTEKLIDYNCLLFHGSSFALDKDGYIFTAKSGTGKSTHAAFWRKEFGDKIRVINDDKPILKIDKEVTIFGTPWNGKHNLGENVSAPLKNICILNRGDKNVVEKVEKKDAFGIILQQTHKSSDPVKVARTLELIDNMLNNVNIYRIYCNLDPECAKEIYNGMKGFSL